MARRVFSLFSTRFPRRFGAAAFPPFRSFSRFISKREYTHVYEQSLSCAFPSTKMSALILAVWEVIRRTHSHESFSPRDSEIYGCRLVRPPYDGARPNGSTKGV